MAIVGPNVSSVIAMESSGTSQKTTGSTNGALTESEPPRITFAPRLMASSICDWMIGICLGIVVGPYFPWPGAPGWIPLAISTTFSMNESATRSSTYTRSAPMHVCPALEKADHTVASAARLISAS